MGVAQRQVVRMHGRAAMRQEAGRLEQRQPGAQSGGDVVRGGGDRGLEPGDGVLCRFSFAASVSDQFRQWLVPFPISLKSPPLPLQRTA